MVPAAESPEIVTAMPRAPRFTQPSKVPGPTWIVPPSATALRAVGRVAQGSNSAQVGKLASLPPFAGVCTYTSVGASAYDGTARRATPTAATPRDTTRRRTNMAGLPPEQGAGHARPDHSLAHGDRGVIGDAATGSRFPSR